MSGLAPSACAQRTLAEAIGSRGNGFNLVRLLAALAVVVFHSYQLNTLGADAADPLTRVLLPVLDLGSVAVGVFFMVSGVFITQSWMNDPHALRFAARRVARIVPGLLVCSLTTVVMAVVFFSGPGWAGLLDWAPWRYVLGNTVLHGLVYDIAPQELRLPGVLLGQDLNGPLWTLYWEGRMYVMVALMGLAAVVPLRQWMGWCGLFLLVAAQLLPAVLSGFVWEVRLWSLFLVGVLLQVGSNSIRVGPAVVVCAALLVAMNWTRNAALTPNGFTNFGVSLFFGALALWVGTAVRTNSRVMQHIGRHDYSYSVYIYHWPLILMLRAALPPMGPLALLATTLAVLAPIALCSWHWIEAPALARMRGLLAK